MNVKILQKIIEMLTSYLSLTHYNTKQDIVAASNASDTGIGAVILCKFKDGKMKAIAHASTTMQAAEKSIVKLGKSH